MSAFNLKSTAITNRDATPPRLNDAVLGKGYAYESIGVERVPQTADAGSQIRLFTMPSSGRLTGLEYAYAGMGSTAAFDVAAWYPTKVPAQSSVVAGALISSSFLAANVSFVVDTGSGWTDAIGTVAQASLPRRQMALWQLLGLPSDPNLDIDIGFTIRTTNVLGNYCGLRARYTR